MFFTAYANVQSEYRRLLLNGKDQEYTIGINCNENAWNNEDFNIIQWGKQTPETSNISDYPITYEDISKLEQDFNTDVTVNLKVDLFYFGSIMKETLQNYTLNYSSKQKDVQMTKSFYQIFLDDGTKFVNPRDFPYPINGDHLLFNGIEEEIIFIENSENVAYLPLRYYYNYFHYKDVKNMVIIVKIKSDTASDMIYSISRIKEYLKENHPDYIYHISSDIYKYADMTETVRTQSMLISVIAFIMLLVIVIGMTFVLIMVMEERRREIAICIAVGSNETNVIFEIILEVFTIIMTGFIIGSTLSIGLLWNGINVAGVNLSTDLRVVLLLLSIALLLVCIVTLPLVLMVKRFMPIEILKSE
jgi:putative ABC transport system permease protein